MGLPPSYKRPKYPETFSHREGYGFIYGLKAIDFAKSTGWTQGSVQIPEKIKEYLSLFPSKKRVRLKTIRRIILESDSKILEALKWTKLSFYYTGMICNLNPRKNDIIIAFFEGHKIKEKGMFRARGKKMHHLLIPDSEEIPKAQIKRLVKRTIQVNLGKK